MEVGREGDYVGGKVMGGEGRKKGGDEISTGGEEFGGKLLSEWGLEDREGAVDVDYAGVAESGGKEQGTTIIFEVLADEGRRQDHPFQTQPSSVISGYMEQAKDAPPAAVIAFPNVCTRARHLSCTPHA